MDDRELPPRLVVADAAAWRAWLDAHEDSVDGVRLVLAKKGTTVPTSLSYAEALEEALCSGWIDGRRNAIDDSTFQQLFTPRRARSIWSQRNVKIVGALIASGRMRARGHAEVDRAKADGRWERAYPGPAAAEVPADLASALECSPTAAKRFAELDRGRRFAIIHHVLIANSASSRARRIAKFVADVEERADATGVDDVESR
ncbi:YdeI/OmpD-associated family protein [Rhodococcus sp. SJ-2]